MSPIDDRVLDDLIAAGRGGIDWAFLDKEERAAANRLVKQGLATKGRGHHGKTTVFIAEDYEQNPPASGSSKKAKRLYVKLRTSAPALELGSISGPYDAIKAIRTLIADRAYETFVTIYLDVQNKVVGYDEFSEGSLTAVTVNTPSIVRNALMIGAVGIITAHQHPSGRAAPSSEDEQLWALLQEQCQLMSILLLDNFVITRDGYYATSEGIVR